MPALIPRSTWDSMKSHPMMTSTIVNYIQLGCIKVYIEKDGIMQSQDELDATQVVFGCSISPRSSNLFDVCNYCRVHSFLADEQVDLSLVKYKGIVKKTRQHNDIEEEVEEQVASDDINEPPTKSCVSC